MTLYAILAVLGLIAGAVFKGFGYASKRSDIAAGKAENQVEAANAEIDRINRASNAASSLRDGQPDPYNRDGK